MSLPMNRDATTRSALLALARSRRTQRALAHAFLHRHAPMPTLRTSLGFMTGTTRIAADDPAHATEAHAMTVLGFEPSEHVVYVVEELGADEAPVIYRLFLRGSRVGHLVPAHVDLEALAARLVPLARTPHEAWMLSTRVIQRRALRASVPGIVDERGEPVAAETPIRKFALQLVVEPVSGHGPIGKTTVTAFLRPEATLIEAWALPERGALARVRYTGIPFGLGGTKDTIVLLS